MHEKLDPHDRIVDHEPGLRATGALLQLLPDRDGRLPEIRWTLPVGEVAHRALVRLAAGGRRIECPELIGQNRFGQPLVGGHQHAHVLPLDLDGDRLLDHVLIHVPSGIGPVARRTMRRLRQLRLSRTSFWRSLPASPAHHWHRCEEFPDLRLPVRYRCEVDRYGLPLRDRDLLPKRRMVRSAAPLEEPSRVSLHPRVDRLLTGARRWRTVTPLVPSRYLKKTGKNSLVGQIQAELQSRQLPPASRIEVLARFHGAACAYHVHRHRDKTPPPQLVAFSLVLQFDTPVSGPIVLGYASHFGLGLFHALP
ncbi:MAG: hypothetical protein KatS3mg111_3803 [Pirellulaceae bacterium]|nr:MAG: hypothetical protein KatS3mg111_3803 [Pirellulaceae bacterium]